MGELELAVGIFLVFNVNFNFVTDLEVGVVAKFGSGDDAVGFEADVHDHFARVDGNDGSHNHSLFVNGLERLGVEVFQVLFF